MKRIIKLFILALAVTATSCANKKGHVCYRFEVYNGTDTLLTAHLASWGNYIMFINGTFDSKYKFHEVENIRINSSLMFSKNVGDDPDPHEIPSSLTPAWEYITAIECDGVTIPKEYFANQENWEISVAHQLNGTFTYISLFISPELIEQFRNN